jgi:hypothetical protein
MFHESFVADHLECWLSHRSTVQQAEAKAPTLDAGLT